MRVQDLDLRELLEFEPGGGLIKLAGERVLLLDAVALGLLRKELISAVGPAAARCVLTRFGYVHGWRTAQSLEAGFPWDSPREWQQAGSRLHTLQGLVIVEPVPGGSNDRAVPFAECVWKHSYEAEQHLLHLGKASEPVCWTLCGFASGYLSYCNRREVICIETSCVGRGDPRCRLLGKPRDEWGDEIAPHRAFYDSSAIDAALSAAARALKTTEEELRRRQEELAVLAQASDEKSGFVARSAAMRRAVDVARRVAGVDTTVLITGESGVGKERIARFIHDASARARGPFVAVNCGAIAETLLESELFGHARGAYTDAKRDAEGLFEAANAGTILLDEIGETSPATQVKLLRVLQEREVRRVGETRSRPVDVRVLAATNSDLAAQVAAGRFRKDLYYRLRVVEVRVPPLRERKEDILELARVFLARTAARFQKRVFGFSPEAADLLLRCAWPGNVRELENAVEHAVVMCRGTRIGAVDLPPELRGTVRRVVSAAPGRRLDEVEREYVLAVLAANQGRREATAEQLGIGVATLYRRLRRYGVSP